MYNNNTNTNNNNNTNNTNNHNNNNAAPTTTTNNNNHNMYILIIRAGKSLSTLLRRRHVLTRSRHAYFQWHFPTDCHLSAVVSKGLSLSQWIFTGMFQWMSVAFSKIVSLL